MDVNAAMKALAKGKTIWRAGFKPIAVYGLGGLAGGLATEAFKGGKFDKSYFTGEVGLGYSKDEAIKDWKDKYGEDNEF